VRLHSLQVTAFGPFADTVEVDFDDVTAAGLFLIQGPTGAGKTSLLDAICWALYAGLPGARRGTRRLRSDHAADTAVPQVVLDFTTGRRRFRVTRSPEFERTKKRGTGTTKAPASVLLQEHLGGAWVVRSTRNDEVGEIVTEVLGMGLEQFSKVVLLPQGEFSAFLRADAEERRGLLERLFDISTWTGVEEWLVEQRRTLAEQVERARAGVITDLARLRDVVVTLPAEVVGDDVWTIEHLDRVPNALTGLAVRCEEHVGSTLADLDASDGQVTRAEQARVEALARAERQTRAAQATAQLAELVAAAPVVAAAARRIERSRQAEVVATEIAARARALTKARTSAQQVQRLRDQLGLGGGVDLAQVAVRRSELGQHSADLAQALRADLDEREQRLRLRRLRAKQVAATSELEELEQLAARLVAGQVAARRSVDTHRARGREHAVLRARHETLGELVWIATALDKARDGAVRLRDEHREARDDELDAHETYLAARQSRLEGMAAELAGQLDTDHECPVCGALEHPHPASTTGDAVSAEQVAHAEDAWHDRRGRRDRVGGQLAAAEALVRSRTIDLARQMRAVAGRASPDEEGKVAISTGEVATGDVSMAEVSMAEVSMAEVSMAEDDTPVAASVTPRAWQSEQLQVRVAMRDLSDPPGTEQLLLARVLAADEAVAAHERRVGALAESLAGGRALLAEVQASLTTRASRRDTVLAAHAPCPCMDLADSTAGADSSPGADNSPSADTVGTVGADSTVDRLGGRRVAETVRRHSRYDEALRELGARLGSADEADAELAACDTRLTETLRARGFATADEARTALASTAEVAHLETMVRDARARRTAAEQVLADEQVRLANTLPPADEAGAVQDALAARSRQRAAQQRDVVARQAHQQLAGLLVHLSAACTQLAPLMNRSDQVSDLAALVTGIGADNTLRMRLSSFVLAARLEKVAAAANERLAVMGDGRYQLQHSDGLESGRRRSGLGLVVRDLWTGAVRDTSTLSGGESFMASLALALGLADAVREEAGGFDLQTLFVDEGFGTLDDDSLEEVLTVLDGLREGGRAVGVVSHVSDLLTRIPTQICVTKTQAGSSVSIRTVSGQTSAA